MIQVSWLLLAAQLVAVPVARGGALPPVGDPGRLSLVIADTVSETDPRALCPDRSCASLFLGKFANTEVLAGPHIASTFSARVRMGSPYNMSYRLAMIVEQREGQEPLIRDQAGFGDRSHEACFEHEDASSLGWRPVGERIVSRRNTICVKQ
jgi:hypothetical protein